MARQRGPVGSCPHRRGSRLDRAVRSLSITVQRGCDQRVGFTLTGWWGGKWESASPTFRFHLVWGPRAGGQQTAYLSHLVGASVHLENKDTVLCTPEGQDPPPEAGCCSFTAPPVSLRPLAALLSNCLNVTDGGQGRSRRPNEACFL